MRIVIVGASGLVGQSLYSAAKSSGIDVIGTYNNKEIKGLVRYDMQSELLRSVVPDIGTEDVVYILSAYSNPSWIFENQAKARELNLNATKRLIGEVLDVNARIVFMSSVEVFDGEQGNYNETSLPSPLNLYGQMKFEVEKYLSGKGGKSCIVRTGWNVGWTFEHRCVVKLTYETLMRPGARMAKDNIFSIIDVRDTAKGLLRLTEKPSLRVCHFASTPPIIRTELADAIINASKYKDLMSYKSVLFSDISYSEPRGRCNQLDNSFAVSALDMKFMNSSEIIRKKVELLDSYTTEIISRTK